MADILCGYTADRDETLVAYLYGDIDEGQRAAFEAHIATCERCRHELKELQGVRGRLREWTAPEPNIAVAIPVAVAASSMPAGVTPSRTSISSAVCEMPAWAQVAAAVLFLGISARIANLDVHYDRAGLTVRTGWSRAVGPVEADTVSGAPRSQVVNTGAATTAPWGADLVALEKRLRSEFQTASSTAAALTARDDRTGADAQLLRKVRALLDDSERKQRNEIALQIAEVVREFDTKRGSDLANIRSLKNVQSVTGAEIARQQEWLNLLTRASIQK
jgi:anti-sigma factor RsiW